MRFSTQRLVAILPTSWLLPRVAGRTSALTLDSILSPFFPLQSHTFQRPAKAFATSSSLSTQISAELQLLAMSSTSAGPAAAGSSSGAAAANKVLQISHEAASQVRTDRPLDQGTWYRTPEPLVIRYRAAAGVSPITDLKRQEEVSRAIWSRLSRFVPKRADTAIFHIDMGIIFDQEVVWPSVHSLIDIVCTTPEALRGVREELEEIRVQDEVGRINVYEQYAVGDDLPQDVLPFDIFDTIVRMTENHHNPFSRFIATLQQMAAKVGTLTGPVRMLWTTRGGSRFEHMICGYIKLSPSSLKLTYEELIHREAGFFDWVGSTAIVYWHIHLRCYKEWAARYPDRAASIEGRDAAESLRSKPKRESKAGASTSGSGTMKKRKVKEEQP